MYSVNSVPYVHPNAIPTRPWTLNESLERRENQTSFVLFVSRLVHRIFIRRQCKNVASYKGQRDHTLALISGLEVKSYASAGPVSSWFESTRIMPNQTTFIAYLIPFRQRPEYYFNYARNTPFQNTLDSIVGWSTMLQAGNVPVLFPIKSLGFQLT
jgi:hypothetical protein